MPSNTSRDETSKTAQPAGEVLAIEAALLAKRTFHFAHPPKHFDLPPHSCGHDDAQWSEFEEHLWCSHCEVDFKPDHRGIFGGPIPINTAMMMGVCFDRVIIATGKLDRYSPETLDWESEAKAAGSEVAAASA